MASSRTRPIVWVRPATTTHRPLQDWTKTHFQPYNFRETAMAVTIRWRKSGFDEKYLHSDFKPTLTSPPYLDCIRNNDLQLPNLHRTAAAMTSKLVSSDARDKMHRSGFG